MKELTKKEKLEFIYNKVKNDNISAYSIAKNTILSEAGVGKILNKKANPRESSVNEIYNYLTENTEKEVLKEFKENPPKYNATKRIDVSKTQQEVAVNTWNQLLTEINELIKSIEKEPPSSDKIQRLRKAQLTKLDILRDLEDLNR